MSTPDERTPLTADIDRTDLGDLDSAEVLRGQVILCQMTLSWHLPCAEWEDGEAEAFDAEQERLCRLFAQAERMDAALSEMLRCYGEEHILRSELELGDEEIHRGQVRAERMARAVLAALSEAARGEEGTP